jgi:hypothetical protein
MYYLPADCWDLASLVALYYQYQYLSKHTNRHPVTLGSRVPEWPVFSTPNIFLIHATTSWELGLDGLSRLIIPYFRYYLNGRFSGVEPAGIGV